MVGTIVSSLVTYGIFKLIGRKQTKYMSHLLFWVFIWVVGVVVSFSYL